MHSAGCWGSQISGNNKQQQKIVVNKQTRNLQPGTTKEQTNKQTTNKQSANQHQQQHISACANDTCAQQRQHIAVLAVPVQTNRGVNATHNTVGRFSRSKSACSKQTAAEVSQRSQPARHRESILEQVSLTARAFSAPRSSRVQNFNVLMPAVTISVPGR